MLIRFYKKRIKKLRRLAVQPDVDLWALDEVHFQQHGSRCRMWVPPEVREPVLLHAPTRKSVGYFGAVRLRDGKFIYAREEDKFNAQSCWQFLKQLRQKSLRSNKRVVIIIDNAKYHHALLHKAWREEAMPRFKLDFLPPYSPELNPIERVWKLTRRLCLHNVYFPKLDEVRETAERQFDQWSGGSSTLKKTMCDHIDTQLFMSSYISQCKIARY
jgi:transposase